MPYEALKDTFTYLNLSTDSERRKPLQDEKVFNEISENYVYLLQVTKIPSTRVLLPLNQHYSPY